MTTQVGIGPNRPPRRKTRVDPQGFAVSSQASPREQGVDEAGNGSAHHGFSCGARPRGPGRASGQGRGGKGSGEPTWETRAGDATPASNGANRSVSAARAEQGFEGWERVVGSRCRGDETSRTPRREVRCNTRTGSRRRKPPGWCKTTKAARETGGNPAPKRRWRHRRRLRTPRLPRP